MKTQLPLLFLCLCISGAAWANDDPTPASKASTHVESKGFGDPYPAADALARKNSSVFLDAWQGRTMDFSRTRAWDASGAKLDLATGTGPSFAWMEKHFNESLRNCSALDSGVTPHGIRWSDDLHDFVLSPQAMQAKLALQGLLFAPIGTRSWKVLQISFYEYFHGNKSQMQGFMRVINFVSTASPKQIRQAVLQLSGERGYQASDTELRNSHGYVGGDSLTLLEQRITPNVANEAMVTADNLDEDDEKGDTQNPLTHWSLHCLVTDDFGKDWLDKANLKTGERWQPADLTFGYIVQTSNIPLGKKTEPFTNAHVDERLARERHMTTQQIAALRKAEETQVQKEIWRDAPQAQKALATQADALDEAADVAEQLRRSGFAEQWASMMKDITHRLGLHIDGWIDAQAALIDAGYQKMADLARRGGKEVREFLSSLWS